MYPLRMVRQTLRLALLLALVALAMSACGGGGGKQQEARSRTLPEGAAGEDITVPAGEYVSDEFKPAVSFRLDEGWNTPLETADILSLNAPKSLGYYSFFELYVIHKVNKVVSSYEAKARPVPDDLVAWLENNPYLNTEKKTKPVSVDGERGKQLDVVASRVPQDYYNGCNEPCLPLFQATYNPITYGFALYEGDKARFIVLDDIEGKTVTFVISASTDKFEEFLPEAQKVLRTVDWKKG